MNVDSDLDLSFANKFERPAFVMLSVLRRN